MVEKGVLRGRIVFGEEHAALVSIAQSYLDQVTSKISPTAKPSTAACVGVAVASIVQAANLKFEEPGRSMQGVARAVAMILAQQLDPPRFEAEFELMLKKEIAAATTLFASRGNA